MDFNIGDTVRRNPDLPNGGKGFGLAPPDDRSRWEKYYQGLGEIIEVETKNDSVCAIRVSWELRNEIFRYDQIEAVVLVTPKNWFEDELFEI